MGSSLNKGKSVGRLLPASSSASTAKKRARLLEEGRGGASTSFEGRREGRALSSEGSEASSLVREGKDVEVEEGVGWL